MALRQEYRSPRSPTSREGATGRRARPNLVPTSRHQACPPGGKWDGQTILGQQINDSCGAPDNTGANEKRLRGRSGIHTAARRPSACGRSPCGVWVRMKRLTHCSHHHRAVCCSGLHGDVGRVVPFHSPEEFECSTTIRRHRTTGEGQMAPTRPQPASSSLRRQRRLPPHLRFSHPKDKRHDRDHDPSR